MVVAFITAAKEEVRRSDRVCLRRMMEWTVGSNQHRLFIQETAVPFQCETKRSKFLNLLRQISLRQICQVRKSVM